MNICIITGSFYPMRCGIADYVFLLAKALSQKDINVSVVTSLAKNQPTRYMSGKISIFRVMKRWDIFELLKLIKYIKQSKADIIHIQYGAIIYNNHIMINFLPLFIKAFIPKSKVVVTFHEMIGPGIFWRLWFSIFLKFTDSIIVTSRINMDWLIRFNYSLKKKILLVSVGSSIPEEKMHRPTDAERNVFRQSLGIDNHTFVIATFGFIFPDKNLEMLIKVAKSLIDAGNKIRIIFMGGESDVVSYISKAYKEKLNEYAISIGMDKFIVHTGFINTDELSRMLLSTDSTVLLYNDGASTRRSSFITVLSCGIPVITTVGEDTEKELVNYQNVLLVKNNDEQQLKEYILKLIASKELRSRLSSGALELSKKYSWNIISRKTIDIYNSLIGGAIKCRNV